MAFQNPPLITAKVDLSPWLGQLNVEIDEALADMALSMAAVDDGSYATRANNQRFGLVSLEFADLTAVAQHARNRAASNCFLRIMASFINFLDKLIAAESLKQAGIVAQRDLEGEAEIIAYLGDCLKRTINEVSRDRSLTNPRKLSQFRGLPEHLQQAALGYFALRRCIEHHQSVAQEDLRVAVWRQKLYVNDREILRLPAHICEGERVRVDLAGEEILFRTGEHVVLNPEDVYGLVIGIRCAIAPEIFNVHMRHITDN
jgi:hypothetical protein